MREIIVPSQYDIRAVLHESFLFSTAFSYQLQRGADGCVERIALKGLGWGHGCGYCQIGALGMALRGYDYRRIMRHYFPQAEIVRTY